MHLAPLILREYYYSHIEAEIRRVFDALIYKPLLEIVGIPLSQIEGYEIKNAADPLITAILKGTVWYERGQFQGRFNARISLALKRIGASFNSRSGSWSLANSLLPTDIRIAQAQANLRYQEMRSRMLHTLDNINVVQVDTTSQTQKVYEKTLSSMESDLQKTMPKKEPAKVDNPASALSRIIIEAKLTEEQKAIIARDWGQNLNLYIKGWAQENILKLREQMQPHVLAGGRSIGLISTIQQNYGVSLRKAKFLARQETALLMSKFQETRYLDIGIQRYRWSDSHDRRVRHDHHELNGKVFRFDSPPVTNKKTGARNNPGQDFNCRCVAVPLVE